jgi:hypothetical protein
MYTELTNCVLIIYVLYVHQVSIYKYKKNLKTETSPFIEYIFKEDNI